MLCVLVVVWVAAAIATVTDPIIVGIKKQQKPRPLDLVGNSFSSQNVAEVKNIVAQNNSKALNASQ